MINHRVESEGQLSHFTMRKSMRRRKSQKSLPQITQIDAEGKGEKKLSNYKITNSKIKQVDAQEKMPKSLPQNTQITAERGRRRAKMRRSMRRENAKKLPAEYADHRRKGGEEEQKCAGRCAGENVKKLPAEYADHRRKGEKKSKNSRVDKRGRTHKKIPQMTQIDAEGKGEKKLSNYKITNSKIK